MSSDSSEKTQLTNAEREDLARKLDGEIDVFLASREQKPYTDGFTKDTIDKVMEEHPAFMSNLNEGEMPPLVEALAQLKYDPEENTADELARNYKDDGNYNFKLKKYNWAVKAYTEGIKQKCESKELMTQLYANRAAAHYYMGNYRSSLQDCTSAVKITSDHMKAVIRGAQCCYNLKRYDESIQWCDQGLAICSTEKVLSDLKIDASKEKKIQERDNRKATTVGVKSQSKEAALLDAIKQRKINIAGAKKMDDEDSVDVLDFSALEPVHPAAMGSRVHLDQNNNLIWPVIFMYPEYSQVDFIQEFCESSKFVDHIEVMFSEPPAWDTNRTYSPEKLMVYFEDADATLVSVSKSKTLLEVLTDIKKKYIIYGGTPSFIILVKGSAFQKQFLEKYSRN